jgi:glycosyltransferase involved in cell wall biosynthesis
MRIVYLMNQDLESPNGIGRFFPLARGLAKRGHEIHIVTLHSDFASVKEARFEREGVHIWYVSQMHVLKKGSQKIYFPAHKLIYLMAKATLRLSYAALNTPADIIHVAKPQPMNSLAGLPPRFLQGKRLFVDCDDLEAANNRFGGAWQRKIIAFFENHMPKAADCVTTHTYVLRDRLIQSGVKPERICYLPNGMDPERFARPLSGEVEQMKTALGVQEKKVIVFVGTMSLVSHAVDDLIRAMPYVLQQIPEAVLLLVGGGEDIENLQEMAQELQLGESVRFLGRMSPEKAALAYRTAGVSVAPVHDNEAGRAALSLKIFESWAAEVPLVTVDVGDRRMVIGDPPAALLPPAGDPEKLAQAITAILKDEDLANTLRSRGLERANHYSWDLLAQKMESVYAQVLGEKRSRLR